MQQGEHERLVDGIYEAAVGSGSWTDALLTLADVTGCVQASMDTYDRSSGLLTSGNNPLIDSEFVAAYYERWRTRFSFWKRSAGFPVGQTIRSAELFDDAFWASAFYNEWSRPQRVGRDGRYASLAVSSHAIALLRACKASGKSFSRDEHRRFEEAAHHFVRALAIHRRLRLAEAQEAAPMAGEAPHGFLVVDRNGRVLTAHERTDRRLHVAGLVTSVGGRTRVDPDNRPIERLIAAAANGSSLRGPRAADIEHRGADGSLLKITVVPVLQRRWSAEPWLALDQPAALLYVSTPEEAARERISRLAAEHGLTSAEAVVALEIAKGDDGAQPSQRDLR
jgi:hypothetical protein